MSDRRAHNFPDFKHATCLTRDTLILKEELKGISQGFPGTGTCNTHRDVPLNGKH